MIQLFQPVGLQKGSQTSDSVCSWVTWGSARVPVSQAVNVLESNRDGNEVNKESVLFPSRGPGNPWNFRKLRKVEITRTSQPNPREWCLKYTDRTDVRSEINVGRTVVDEGDAMLEENLQHLQSRLLSRTVPLPSASTAFSR